MSPDRVQTTTAILLAAGLSSCSLQHPYNPPPRSRPAPSTAPIAPNPTNERGGSIPALAQAAQRALAPDAGRRTPRAALARYASLAVNWNWQNLTTVERRLAAMSLGQARAQSLQAAAQASANTALRVRGVSNSGRPVSIAPGQGPAAGQWVIVTVEQTRGRGPYSGLPRIAHVTFAHVVHTPRGYVVDRWEPQT